MAVDTADKRGSALGSFSVMPFTLPIPDAAIGPQTRAHALYLYSGLEASDTETSPTVIEIRRQGIILFRGWF